MTTHHRAIRLSAIRSAIHAWLNEEGIDAAPRMTDLRRAGAGFTSPAVRPAPLVRPNIKVQVGPLWER